MLASKINPCACTATTLPVRLPFEEKGSADFLGLRPLEGYASLKLSHVMSCFCMRNVSFLFLCYDMAG